MSVCGFYDAGKLETTTEKDEDGYQSVWNNEKADFLPNGTRTPLQYTVYDSYAPTSQVSSLPFSPVTGYAMQYNPYPVGLATSTKVRLLGTDNWVTSTTYYDNRSRIVQVLSCYPGAMPLQTDMAYDFTDNVLKQRETVGKNVLESSYEYDERSRLLAQTNIWNGSPVEKVTYTYDEVGRLTGKEYNGNRTESISYNIRGWMTETTTGGLTQIVHYTDGPGTPCYNGNISSLLWKEHTQTDIDQTQGYRFTYDGQNRMKDAIYGVTGYDRNGNLTGLLRYGRTETETYGLVDNLNMAYQGNQLKSVYDNATHTALTGSMEFKDGANQTTEYVYDENGNLTKDLNKNIADIQYNLLDLPQKVEFENGNRIYFLYAADGTKIRSTYISGNDTTTVSYFGNAVYENDVLVRFLTTEGYITPAESNSHALSDSNHPVDGIFHYYFHDHQGNVRAVFAQDGTMEECNDYYPFGGWRNATVASASTDNSVQPYKYNGKELVRKFGLDWYDYGARWYDAALGRWNAVDPMAESYYGMTPYNYCGNEPVNRTDPDGMDYWSTSDPATIASFMQAIQSYPSPNSSHNVFEYFEFSSWNHCTDQEFLDRLTFNDQTNMFYTSYGRFEDGELKCIGISIPALSNDGRRAKIEGAYGRWSRRASGAVISVHPEFEIFALARGFSKLFGKGIQKLFSKKSPKLPTQIHHFATNKNQSYVTDMETIAKKYGLDLDGAWNKAPLPHLGRHPNAYHKFVLKEMKKADQAAAGDKSKFLKLFDKNVKRKVKDNPNLLRKSGWNNNGEMK